MSRSLFSVLGFFHKVDVFYCVVKKLELSSEYFGRYWTNRLSFKTTEDVLLKTKDCLLQSEDVFLQTKDSLLKTEDNSKCAQVMVSCKLKTYSWQLKTIYWQLQKMANELWSTGPYWVPLLATRCLYWEMGRGWWGGYIWQVNWTQHSTTLDH